MKPEDFKKIRAKLKLTQDQLAKVLGLSGKKAVYHIESGMRNPNRLAAAIMRALDDLPSKSAQELMTLLRKYMEK